MGIDYGTKRVGIAIAPAGSTLAFPHDVYSNDRELFDRLVKEIKSHDIQIVVLGESYNFAGRENVVMNYIKELKSQLEIKFPEKTICYEPEFYTSAQAERLQGRGENLDA